MDFESATGYLGCKRSNEDSQEFLRVLRGSSRGLSGFWEVLRGVEKSSGNLRGIKDSNAVSRVFKGSQGVSRVLRDLHGVKVDS